MSGFTFRPVRAEELPVALEQAAEAFGGTADEREDVFRAAMAAGLLWGVDAGGRLAGHCRLRAVDHFFGGRPVACMEVAGVAVPNEHRRAGVATAMMEGAAAWGSHQGLGLSLLYPAVPHLYRRLGWEYAGTAPTTPVPAGVEVSRAEPMRPAQPADLPAIKRCHERYIATLNGPGRRNERQWDRLMESETQYVLDGAGGVDAYALLVRGPDPSSPDGVPAVDWAAVTPRGFRAVTGLLAGDLADTVGAVRGPLPEPATFTSTTWGVPASAGLHWMARALVLDAAIAQRGYPASVETSVTFAVDDRVLSQTQGPWRLDVSSGTGRLTPGSVADVVLDARAAGPLFTGYRSAAQLSRAGLLDGPPDALASLTASFSGEAPVLLDFF